MATLQGNELKVEGGRKGIEIALLPSNIFLLKMFTEKTYQNLTGKASVKLLIGIT